jgi:hypothetical protein
MTTPGKFYLSRTLLALMLGPRPRLTQWRAGTSFLVAVLCVALAGCGSASIPQLGAISVTNVGGASTAQLTSVSINELVAVTVAVGQDQQNLGVHWNLTCLGSPVTPAPANPCGTIAPAYVGIGNGVHMIYTAPLYIPVGNTVTMTANVTSDPAVTSSVTVTIVPLPITIAITMPPPTSLGVNGTALIAANVTNDLAAAGVNWTLSCAAGAACGSLQSGLPIATQTASGGQILYTAPAIIPATGSVTITATSVSDPTKSATTMVTIVPVSIVVAPVSVSVPVGTTQDLTATVAYDSSNAGVDWSAPTCGSAGGCGSLSVSHTASGTPVTYTAPQSIPAGTTVTVVATSTANPAATATVTITIAPPPPLALVVTPTTATVQVNGTVNLTANITYDQANAGADWSLSCGSPGACGSLALHTGSGGVNAYTAPSAVPAGGTVTAIAASTSVPATTASSTITIIPAISIAFTPAPPTSIIAGAATSFTATVTNDVGSAGVDWTSTCTTAPCGTFSSNHTASGTAVTFTAPITAPAGTVTVIATSTASNTALPVQSISAPLTLIPVISVNFIPYAPSQLQVSNQLDGILSSAPVSLLAAVSNDATNAGIDWSVCSNIPSCGEFQVTPAIAATATSIAVNAVYASTVHTASGQPALYVPPSQPPTPSGVVTITAKATNPAATSTLATATASIAIVSNPVGIALSGVVMAGSKPVSGAAVTLYAAGTTGYSSTASPLIVSGSATQVTTGTNGLFSIPAGYACPSQSSQMYLVALGGNPGAGVNPNLALMTALGPCSGLSSAVTIVINEVTTVASIWPLAPFALDYGHIGSSSANATVGLANAFANVNNLANIAAGQAIALTPVGNSTVPQSEINALASILNTCTTTSGGAVGDGSPCDALFTAANPSTLASEAPANTLQAALNIAQSPAFNTISGYGATIYSLLPATPAFTPVLTAAPNDWSIALNFTGGGLSRRSNANALAVDQVGDIWITDNRFSSVTELTPMGAPLSPAATGTSNATSGGFHASSLTGAGPIAIDPLGNAWVASGSDLTEISPTGIIVSGAGGYTGGGLSGQTTGLAIDGTGNLWAVDAGSPGALSWFAGANTTFNGAATAPGTALSPAAGLTAGINSPSGAIQVDTSGTVWLLNNGDNSAAELSSSNGSFIQSDFGYQQIVPLPVNSVLSQGVSSQIAIDNAGNVFLSNGSQLADLLAGGSSANDGGLGTISSASGDQLSTFLALDGAEHFWLLINGGSNFCPSSTSVVELSSGGSLLNTNPLGCGYLGNGIGATDNAIAVDNAGDLWILGSGSVTELIGVAAPVVTPFSVGVQNKTLGKKP